MKTFSYKSLYLIPERDPNGYVIVSSQDSFDREAPKLGLLGWELVSIIPGPGQLGLLAFFMRAENEDPGVKICIPEADQEKRNFSHQGLVVDQQCLKITHPIPEPIDG